MGPYKRELFPYKIKTKYIFSFEFKSILDTQKWLENVDYILTLEDNLSYFTLRFNNEKNAFLASLLLTLSK